MKWVTSCLRNSLVIYILAVACCLGGLVALYTLPLSPFPQIPLNSIVVELDYPGANAQTVQKQITSEMVPRLQGLENVNYISSFTQAGMTNIYIRLNDSVTALDKLQAQLQIIQAINAAHLPSSVPQPNIMVSSGQSGLVQLVVSSTQLSLFQMSNFIQANLNPQV